MVQSNVLECIFQVQPESQHLINF